MDQNNNPYIGILSAKYCSFTTLPSLGQNGQKTSSQGEKASSNRSSGGSKLEDNCENCNKNKVCLQMKCIDSQQINFCCEKCYKKKHPDHCKDFVIDISSIDSQIRKLHQEVIDGPLFRLATDLREMTKEFNDLKKSFPSIQEIPIVEFALHSKRINQINVRSSKEEYDRMRKESIKSAIKISKIDRKNSKLKLNIDEQEIEQNTLSLLKKYEDTIKQQQQKLDEFKERTYKIFQDIRKTSGSVSNIQYQSLVVGSKPISLIEREIQPQLKEKMNYINIDSQNDDYEQSYNNSNINSYNSNNNLNSFSTNINNQSYINSYNSNNQQHQQGNMNIMNSNNVQVSQQMLHPFMYTQTKQKGNNSDILDTYQNDYKGLQQNHLLSNSISSARYESNSNNKQFMNESYLQQPKLEDIKKQMQEQYEQYTQMQKLEGISQSLNSNSNQKPLSRTVNNLFSENNPNNNSMSCSNSNIDNLRSTPYKQQKTQKKINEYFMTNKNQKPIVKQEEQNQIKSSLLQNEKFMQYQQQQLLYYEQQKQKLQLQNQQQQQQQQQLQQQQLQQQQQQQQLQQQQLQFNQQNNLLQQQQLQLQQIQPFQQQQNQQFQQQHHQLQQSKQKLLNFNQPQYNQKKLPLPQPPQQRQEQKLEPISVFQNKEISNSLLTKKPETVFMKSDVLVIEELMKLTQSTVYTQYDDDNDLRKSPSQQIFSESQAQSFSNNRSVSQQILNENQLKQKQMNEIVIEQTQESNTNKIKQPNILNSLDLICSEQLSDVNEQSSSIQMEVSVPISNRIQDKQQGLSKQAGKGEDKQKQKIIIQVPSTSSLSSVSKSDQPESKVFYQQTFGAQQQQENEDQQNKISQELYCWESFTNTQNQDKDK